MTERLNDLILVDCYDRPIGTAGKAEAHAAPLLHRAFSVFLINDNGELLLQKRAAGTRMTEELGATCPLREIGSFVYLHRFADRLYEYEYDHVLLGHHNGPFTPDPGEIAALRWVGPGGTGAGAAGDPGTVCTVVPHRRPHGAAAACKTLTSPAEYGILTDDN